MDKVSDPRARKQERVVRTIQVLLGGALLCFVAYQAIQYLVLNTKSVHKRQQRARSKFNKSIKRWEKKKEQSQKDASELFEQIDKDILELCGPDPDPSTDKMQRVPWNPLKIHFVTMAQGDGPMIQGFVIPGPRYRAHFREMASEKGFLFKILYDAKFFEERIEYSLHWEQNTQMGKALPVSTKKEESEETEPAGK